MTYLKYLLLLFFILLFSRCNKDSLLTETPHQLLEEEAGVSDFKKQKPNLCEFGLSGFADFPFQSIVIDNQDYPHCTGQLCILIQDWDTNPYFSINSSTLKICETGFENMWHHANCDNFAPTQISFLQMDGGTELQFEFEDDFWNCFFGFGTYPGMEFQFNHALPFI